MRGPIPEAAIGDPRVGTVLAFASAVTSATPNPVSFGAAGAGGLRLVFPDRGPSLEEARARRAIAEENAQAAALTTRDTDIRQILALRVEEALEGGRAALLPAPRRRELVRAGERLGLRPFESNLIIAIVQDSARRGKSVVSQETRQALGVIPAPPSVEERRSELWMWLRIALATAALAGLLFTAMVEWVTG